jgi:hypothetical protein
LCRKGHKEVKDHLYALLIGLLIIGGLVSIIGVITICFYLALHFAGGWGVGALVVLMIAYGLGSAALEA